jgi:lipoteichoic acid synthase
LEDYDIVTRYGIIGHTLIDLVRPTKVNRTSEIQYGNKIVSSGTSSKRPNIILIQFESLDANVINYRYQGEYVTPFLHSLTTRSLYYPFTLCYRKLGGTSDCEIAVNNSIEPPVDYSLMMYPDYYYPNSVVKVLQKNGYKAEAFHGNTGDFYRRKFAYNAMGYDNFFDSKRMELPEKGWGVPDHEVMNYVEKHLHVLKTPFFISIITMSSHEPFNLFKHFVPDNRFEGIQPELTGRYFASIAYTDSVVKKFIRDIQKKYPNTYFFLYGDHTPYIINNGPFRRSVLNKNEQMEMVPLFIIAPNGQCRYEHEAVASYLDIAPTILHASGVPFGYKSLGVNLLTNNQLQQPITYREQLYNRSELFKEMLETYKDMWSGIVVGGAR